MGGPGSGRKKGSGSKSKGKKMTFNERILASQAALKRKAMANGSYHPVKKSNTGFIPSGKRSDTTSKGHLN